MVYELLSSKLKYINRGIVILFMVYHLKSKLTIVLSSHFREIGDRIQIYREGMKPYTKEYTS